MDFDFEKLTVMNTLTWIVYRGGAFVAVNWFFSWAFENAKWWHEQLKSQARSVIMLGISLLLGFGAQYAILNPAFIERYEQYFLTVLLTMAAWLTTQMAHNKNPSKGP